jgi:uncharacterized protein with PIN domain
MSQATYRILVDENTSPRVARLLRSNGHDAIHVTGALAVGATDSEIAGHASETSRVVLTHDDDFLRPEYTREISVLYYTDDTLGANELADRVETVTEYVPDQDDLPPITNLSGWA